MSDDAPIHIFLIHVCASVWRLDNTELFSILTQKLQLPLNYWDKKIRAEPHISENFVIYLSEKLC